MASAHIQRLVVPVNPPISEYDADLVAVSALLVQHHPQPVRHHTPLLAFHFALPSQNIHPVDFQLYGVEGNRMRQRGQKAGPNGILNKFDSGVSIGLGYLQVDLLLALDHELIERNGDFGLPSLIFVENVLPPDHLQQLPLRLGLRGRHFQPRELNEQKVFVLEPVLPPLVVDHIGIGALGVAQFAHLYLHSELPLYYFELAHWVFVDLLDGWG